MSVLPPKYSDLCDFDAEVARGYYAAYQSYVEVVGESHKLGSRLSSRIGVSHGVRDHGKKTPTNQRSTGAGTSVRTDVDWTSLGKKRGVLPADEPVRKRARGCRGGKKTKSASVVGLMIDEITDLVVDEVPPVLPTITCSVRELMVEVDVVVRDYITAVVTGKWSRATELSVTLTAIVRNFPVDESQRHLVAEELFSLVQLSCAYLGKPGECVFATLGLVPTGGNCGPVSCSSLAGDGGSALCSRDGVHIGDDSVFFSPRVIDNVEPVFQCRVCDVMVLGEKEYSDHESDCLELFFRSCDCGMTFPDSVAYGQHVMSGECVSSSCVD